MSLSVRLSPREDDPSDDDKFQRLVFLQCADDIIEGNITISEESEVVDAIAKSIYGDVEEVPDSTEELIDDFSLMEFVPKPWKTQHTDEEWAELVMEAMAALDGMDVEDIQNSFIEYAEAASSLWLFFLPCQEGASRG